MPYAMYVMPVLIHATAWWLAGLFASAWWHTPVPYGLLCGAALVLVRARRAETLVLPAALIVGWSSRTEEERCVQVVHERLQRGNAGWLAVEDRRAGAGRRPTVVRGMIGERERRARCAVRATVHFAADHVRSGLVMPGRRLAITAASLRTGDALRLSVTRVVGTTGTMRPLVVWRDRLGRTIDRHFRGRAPLVRALLIADQRGIAPEVREVYADAGLVHLLSVSGMHVAIIAGALLTLGGAMRFPRRWLDVAALGVVTGYIVLLGCPAPAVRSGVMLGVVSLSKRWQRPVHEWTALALGAAIPTLNPLVVHDLGWQLSVGGMAALVAARALLRRTKAMVRATPRPTTFSGRCHVWLCTRRGIGGWIVSEICTGVVATLVTLPVIAWTFGRVSLVAPLSNLVAGPVVSALQPALFVALLWAMLAPAPIASWLADATQPIMALLDGVAAVAASAPGGVWPLAPTLATAVGTGAAAAFFVRGTAARRGTPWYIAAAGAVSMTLWLPTLRPASGELEMHVIDVGQGDALALRTPRGRWVLVDAGRRWDGGDAGRRVVVPYVRRRGGEVALFILSHPHDDHAGGAASVVRALRPAIWWEPAFVSASPGYRAALAAVRGAGTHWQRVWPGQRFRLDGVELTVLAPDSSWTVAQHDANETSVIVRVQYGATRLLLTGDAERDEEAWMLAQVPRNELTADVLKLGHHGSRTSSSGPLLDAVSPRLALASVGAGNRYGHPAPETLAALLARRIPLLRTDLEGTVVVSSDGHRLSVKTADGEWTLPPGNGVASEVDH